MAIKKQLAAYYDKQGLTGKHRRKAMQWDMRQVRKETARKCERSRFTSVAVLFDLHWGSMPNPKPLYWAHRDMATGR